MSMINCPECGEKISNKAESCPHCGCPKSEFKGAVLKPTWNSMNICPRCGYIDSGGYNCGYCSHDMINTGVTKEALKNGVYGNGAKWEEEQFNKIRTNPEFDEKSYQDRITNQNWKYGTRNIPAPTNFVTNVPKCPTCNSTQIHKIGFGERFGTLLFFGLFSRVSRSTFECNSCGYMW